MAKKFRKKKYLKALKLVLEHSQEHKDLQDWLDANISSMSELVAAVFQGRRLEFKWIEAPERGRTKMLTENIIKNNPFIDIFNPFSDKILNFNNDLDLSFAGATIVNAPEYK